MREAFPIDNAADHLNKQVHVAKVMTSFSWVESQPNSAVSKSKQGVHHTGTLTSINDGGTHKNHAEPLFSSRFFQEPLGFDLSLRVGRRGKRHRIGGRIVSQGFCLR